MNVKRKKIPIGKIPIGICVSEEKYALMRIVVKRLETYPYDLTVITFRIENLDMTRLKVTGTCFVKKAGVIEKSCGTFPIPAIIYMQSYAERDQLRNIEETTGCKIFNNFIFEKWQEWNLLVNSPILSSHLPHTQRLSGEKELNTCLARYEDVFIKPISPTMSHSGKGIVRIKIQKETGFELIYLMKKKIVRKQFKLFDQLWTSLQSILTFDEYILQQGIVTTKINDLPTDIRLNMNKNGKGEWNVSALFGRIALNGNHVAAGGGAQYVPIANKQFLDTLSLNNKNKTKSIVTYITEIGYKVCQTFDQLGYHMADLGMDLGIDEAGHIWIFEVNPLPFPFASPIWDESWIKPLEYARYLIEQDGK